MTVSDGERAPPEDLIDSSGYVLNSAIKDARISLEFFDPSQLAFLDPNVPHLRASLLIKSKSCIYFGFVTFLNVFLTLVLFFTFVKT